MASLIVCALLLIPNQAYEHTVKPPIVQERIQFTYLPIPETKPVPVRKGRILDGWCTSYVKSKRKIEWSGNAGTWAVKAAAVGYEVSTVPKVGAIYVTSRENSRSCPRCGHVALVEKVEKDRIQVSEMNYVAYGRVSYRWLSTDYLTTKQVKFIY